MSDRPTRTLTYESASPLEIPEHEAAAWRLWWAALLWSCFTAATAMLSFAEHFSIRSLVTFTGDEYWFRVFLTAGGVAASMGLAGALLFRRGTSPPAHCASGGLILITALLALCAMATQWGIFLVHLAPNLLADLGYGVTMSLSMVAHATTAVAVVAALLAVAAGSRPPRLRILVVMAVVWLLAYGTIWFVSVGSTVGWSMSRQPPNQVPLAAQLGIVGVAWGGAALILALIPRWRAGRGATPIRLVAAAIVVLLPTLFVVYGQSSVRTDGTSWFARYSTAQWATYVRALALYAGLMVAALWPLLTWPATPPPAAARLAPRQ